MYFKNISFSKIPLIEIFTFTIMGELFNSSLIQVKSGQAVIITGFYEPLDHSGECLILDSEKKIFLCRGSEAPKILSCQHNIEWGLMDGQ